MRIGIDLGGTKTEIIVLDEQNIECFRKRVATPSSSYSKIVETLSGLIKEAHNIYPNASIGIGIPGAISPDSGVIKNANTTTLIDQNLSQDLSNSIGHTVKIANDANCFCLSEATDGAGKGENTVFGVILGTGVGGGICINGQILSGPNAITGEWGHNPLPWPTESELPGSACYCGKKGCIETWLSGPGFTANYLAYCTEQLSEDNSINNSNINPSWIFQQYNKLAIATEACDLYIDRLARGLASIINVIDPNVIVLGGGLSNIPALYGEVEKRWGRYVFSDCINTQLRQAKHGDSSGVRGAAWLGYKN